MADTGDGESCATATMRFRIGRDGIVRGTCLPGTDHTLADARENISAKAGMCAGRRPPTLVDMRGVRSHDREARQYYAGPETARGTTAVALLVESHVSRVIANFFLGMNKPLVPTRLFTSELDALQWLTGYLTP